MIDTSVQKGGVPGISGCVEHIAVVTQLIKEAKEGKKDLVVLWLDLANAYGSVPHKLLEASMKSYHVPQRVIKLVTTYYGNFYVRHTVGDKQTRWQRLEKGIVAGCTISVILFTAAMNLLVKTAEKECRGPKTKSGIRQPPIRAIMDDLTTTVPSIVGTRWILRGLEDGITWARMVFKP